MKIRFAKTIRITLIISLMAGAGSFGRSGTAHANPSTPDCSTRTLRGLYVFRAHGWNIAGGVAVPKAIVEGIDFAGDGTLVSPFATVSLNGSIFKSVGSVGVYTVEADCTGTLTFTGGASFDIFVEPGEGDKVWMIQTGPGPAVFEGAATRVSP